MEPRYKFTQGENVLGQIVMKRAHIGAVLNFDLCDLQKVGQIKNTDIMPYILIRCTHDNKILKVHFIKIQTFNFEMIQPLVQEL
jgi:hypothetical protein